MPTPSSVPGPTVEIRPAVREDFPRIQEVCVATGQHPGDTGVSTPYLTMLLATGETLVATRGSRLVGWGATKVTPFGSLLTDVFIDPAAQGHGVGAALLARLWPQRASTRFTFSSQDRRALPLYARTGLIASWPLLYLRGAPSRLPEPSSSQEPMCRARAVSPEQAAAAETSFTGMSREADFRYWADTQGASAVVIHRGRRLVAVGALGSGAVLRLAVEDPDHAEVALLAALRQTESATVGACLPGAHPALGTLLTAGFRIEDYDFHMCTPGLSLPIGWVYSPGLA